MNRSQWETKHGPKKLTNAWKRLGWTWQPEVCRCLESCRLNTNSKHDARPKASKEVLC
jgi:hypothetical protein